MHRDNIPQLSEKEIEMILVLAENGPMSGYDFHLGGRSQRGNRKALMSSSHWLTVKRHLGDQGENFITCLKPRGRPQKDRQGRRKNMFWLTPRGSALALLNNANPEKVRLHALESCEKDEDKKAIEVYFKLREISPKIANILDRFSLLVGKLEPTDLYKQLLPEMVSMNENEIMKLFSVARKTEYWKHTKGTMEKFINELGKVLSYE